MGTSISSDIGDPEPPFPIWITEMGTSSDQPTSYTSVYIVDPEPPLPNWITEIGTSSDQPTSYTSVYIVDPEPPLPNWITEMGTSSDQPTSYTSFNIGNPEPPLPNWIAEMSTSSHQPTSYTSFNIGDPEPPLPNWITEMGTSSHQPTSYTSFYAVVPEPPLLNSIAEMDTSSDQPTSYTSFNKGDPEPPLPNLINEQVQGLYPISRDAYIYRVPRNIRQVNEEAFTPVTVSIGPFHHGNTELQPWNENKLRYLQAFLNRTEKSLEDCIEFVKRLEGRARACYRDEFDMASNAFVKMMLVDSCFIIEVICRSGHNYPEPADYLSNPDLISLVLRDMLLLENQIPFFVLHDLFHLGVNNPGEDEDKFLELSFNYFKSLIPTITEPGDRERVFRNVKCHLESGLEVKHFTDLLRICCLPEKLNDPSMGNHVRIPNAASLDEAGMKFKLGKSKCLLDMNYNNGFLEIPKFKVDYHSECLLKNLIALETCHYPFDSYIIDYVYFMDMLIDTATDVDLLVQKGIIENYFSDTAGVASLFNSVGQGTGLFGQYYFASISDDMNAYYKAPWNKWKATFKRDYCSTPWKIASILAAIILLVLTLIQAIWSII